MFPQPGKAESHILRKMDLKDRQSDMAANRLDHWLVVTGLMITTLLCQVESVYGGNSTLHQAYIFGLEV